MEKDLALFDQQLTVLDKTEPAAGKP